MARKNKNEEVTIIATERDSDVVTDLQVLVGEQVIGEIYQSEENRQYQVTFKNQQKGTAVSIEDAVQAIIADYNLHK